jgi:hypothetical protein
MCKVTKIVVGLLLFYCSIGRVSAQLAQKIGDEPFKLNASAVLELQSVNKGFLPPRMTTAERDGIYKPAKGLTIFNVSINGLEVNAGSLDTPVWAGTTVSNPAITATRIIDDYTILSSDSTVLFDATAKNLIATLPDATGLTGKIFYVRKDDATTKTLTIVPNLKILGTLSTLILNYAKTVKVQSDGTSWVVID